MLLIGFDADPLDAKKRSDILQKRRFQTLVSGLVALKGMNINRVTVDKIYSSHEEIERIQRKG